MLLYVLLFIPKDTNLNSERQLLRYLLLKTMDYIQLLATVLEGVGLGIAILDMRYPMTMKRVEMVIDETGDSLLKYSKDNADTMILAIFVIGGLWLFNQHVPITAWVGFWISIGVGSSLIVVALLGDFIQMLNRLSLYDQAITTLGVFLALTGLLIDFLQLIQMV